MSVAIAPAAHPGRQGGFTLIELLIAVVIVALLLGVALPSFMDSTRKSRRSDAFAAVAAIQQAQERWRSTHPDYGTFADIGNSLANSPRGHYTLTIAVAANAGQGYTVTATPVGSQANDSPCTVMAATVAAGDIQYSSGSNVTAANPDPNRCWAR